MNERKYGCWMGIEGIEEVSVEDKHGFVSAFQEALIKFGAGRYDHLKDEPVWYLDEYDEGIPEGMQVIEYRGRKVDITCDSLTSIAKEIVSLIA